MPNFPAYGSIFITIISQVLGLENDQSIDELTLGLLFSICVPDESVPVPRFKFVEYLEDLIHIQLLNFNSMRSFRYQAYLLNLFMSQNDLNFQDIQAFLEAETIHISWLSTIRAYDNMFGTFNFINQIMSRIYQMIFQTTFPEFCENSKTYCS